MSDAGSPLPGQQSREAIVAEWVSKAEGDLRVARREMGVSEGANFDAVAFHSQQAAEKIMKAVLIARGRSAPHTHDLSELARFLTDASVASPCSALQLRALTMAAVHSRYPGYTISGENAAHMLGLAELVWSALRPLL